MTVKPYPCTPYWFCALCKTKYPSKPRKVRCCGHFTNMIWERKDEKEQ